MLARLLSAYKFIFLATLLLIASGLYAIATISKEATPDVTIPTVRVVVAQTGAAPEDIERLLVLPVEREVSRISGIDRIRAWVFEGRATLRIDFKIGTDMATAIDDVKDAVDRAKPSFPREASEPNIVEDNPALEPILSIGLYGDRDVASMVETGRRLRQKVQRVKDVFEVDMFGDLDDIIEIQLNMQDILALGLSPLQISSRVADYNRMINSGEVAYQGQQISINVPGMLGSLEDVGNIPLMSVGQSIITVSDIASVGYTHRDPLSSAFINGAPSLTLEVSKQLGASTVDVANGVKAALAEASIPDDITVEVMDDQSVEVMDMLHNLSSNVLTTVLIVVVVLALMLSASSALLVGITIPLSFLMAFSALHLMGYTANSIVLFGLILATGMLVDSAIVVSENADKLRQQGIAQPRAYQLAAQRMAAPIIASLMTTVAAFVPMLLWPGTTGEFMRYLPITVITTLLASLVASLVIMPALAQVMPSRASLAISRHSQIYATLLFFCVKRARGVVSLALLTSIAIVVAYSQWHLGTEFFPEGDAETVTVRVYGQGAQELDAMQASMASVESRLTSLAGVDRITTTVSESSFSDMIGYIRLSLSDWREREDADAIIASAREALGDLAPLSYEILARRSGPRSGKPVAITLSAERPEVLAQATDRLMAYMQGDEVATTDVTTERKTPGKAWRIQVDKGLASHYGVSLADIGGMVNLATSGLNAASLTLPGFDDEVDVLVRLPREERTTSTIESLKVPSAQGMIPLAIVSRIEEGDKVTVIRRSDQRRTMRIEANVEDGAVTSEVEAQLKSAMPEVLKDFSEVDYEFRGESQDSDETRDFLIVAFVVALALMLAVLLLQMNSFRQSGLIFLAVVFAVVGVLLTLLMMRQPFGVVFSGLAILSLAGISINHNIIMIDEFNHLRQRGITSTRAAVQSALSRFRPIVLTVLTTSLGLIPMVLEISFDVKARTITLGDPAMAMWSQLSSNLIGGLIFSAVISLFVTPCLMVLSRKKAGA